MEVNYKTVHRMLEQSAGILRLTIIDDYGEEGVLNVRDGDPECMEALEHLYTAMSLLEKYAEQQQMLPHPF